MKALLDTVVSGIVMLVILGAVLVLLQQPALPFAGYVAAAAPECVPAWQCASWAPCAKLNESIGRQERQCTDGCGSLRNESQFCDLPLVKVPLPAETEPTMPRTHAPKWETYHLTCEQYYDSPLEDLIKIRASCVQHCEEQDGFPSWGCDEIMGVLDCRCT